MARRLRIDRLLVERGLFASRTQAQSAIAAGRVSADEIVVARPSEEISADAVLRAEPAHPYVSRGGVKLAAALDHFRSDPLFDPRDRICLDVGASTGGFTEVLLARGARRVYAVDVGRDQLHRSLRRRAEVVSLEATDIRALNSARLPEQPDFAPSMCASSRSSSSCLPPSRCCAHPPVCLRSSSRNSRRAPDARNKASCAIRAFMPRYAKTSPASPRRAAGRSPASSLRSFQAARVITSSSSPRIARQPTRAPVSCHCLGFCSRAMTLPRTITVAKAAAQPKNAVWRAEIIVTVKLGWPIALTQLGQIAMMTTDLALIGRLGDGAIAAVGLAHLILFVGFVFGMGPVSAVAPLAAQAFGARDPRLLRRSLPAGPLDAV